VGIDGRRARGPIAAKAGVHVRDLNEPIEAKYDELGSCRPVVPHELQTALDCKCGSRPLWACRSFATSRFLAREINCADRRRTDRRFIAITGHERQNFDHDGVYRACTYIARLRSTVGRQYWSRRIAWISTGCIAGSHYVIELLRYLLPQGLSGPFQVSVAMRQVITEPQATGPSGSPPHERPYRRASRPIIQQSTLLTQRRHRRGWIRIFGKALPTKLKSAQCPTALVPVRARLRSQPW